MTQNEFEKRLQNIKEGGVKISEYDKHDGIYHQYAGKVEIFYDKKNDTLLYFGTNTNNVEYTGSLFFVDKVKNIKNDLQNYNLSYFYNNLSLECEDVKKLCNAANLNFDEIFENDIFKAAF